MNHNISVCSGSKYVSKYKQIVESVPFVSRTGRKFDDPVRNWVKEPVKSEVKVDDDLEISEVKIVDALKSEGKSTKAVKSEVKPKEAVKSEVALKAAPAPAAGGGGGWRGGWITAAAPPAPEQAPGGPAGPRGRD